MSVIYFATVKSRRRRKHRNENLMLLYNDPTAAALPDDFSRVCAVS